MVIFSIGVFGFLSRKNLVALSHYLQDLRGQILAFFVIAVAASEAAIGLAIVIAIFRTKATAHVDEVKEMRG